MDIKNIDKKYRPLPFWSWNEKLDTEETRRQAGIMAHAGMGGFFMHARGGLQTEYMSDEWFSNIIAGIEEAKKFGMEAWAYDENGYPSGFGNGIVNGLGEEFQQKILKCEKLSETSNKGTTICEKDGYRFYYEVNPSYVDLMYEKTTQEFIKNIYEPYYEKFQDGFAGFFTDEPNLGTFSEMPWSHVIPYEYKKKYGEDITERLIELFYDTGDYENTRIKFRKLTTDLFSKNYFKKLYDWCNEHNLKLTGHILLEESLAFQINASGASMPHYEYFHIPGVDNLSRNQASEYLGIQVNSVACQLGKNQVITESFACGGHDLSFQNMRNILESQMVRGVNRYCAHLEGYSLRGERKRDHPPAMYYQQPWWKQYSLFADAMSRIGMLLSEGNEKCDTLLLHPIVKAWTKFKGTYDSIKDIDETLKNAVDTLEEKHILFHFGDETVIERHGRIENNEFVIGKMRYKKVIVLYDIMLETTRKLLGEFSQNGGEIVSVCDIEENAVTDNKNITYTMREFDGYDIHYFVNLTEKPQTAKITKGSKILDIITGEWNEFDGNYTFSPYDSLIVKDDGTTRKQSEPIKEPQSMNLGGYWKLCEKPLNLYTLDFCRYSIDGELQEERGFVLNVLYRAMKLKKPCKVELWFDFFANTVPDTLYMLLETPQIFKIAVNEKEINYTDEGYYIDTAFKKINIQKYMKKGKNQIKLECIFKQSDKVYEDFEKSFKYASVRNKMSYDTEIEAIYLLGDFGVYTNDSIIPVSKRAYKVDGNFRIDSMKNEIKLTDIDKQGFMFFAGSITLEKEFDLKSTDYKLKFDSVEANAIEINVNGKDVKTLIFNPFEADISKYLKEGRNKIRLTFTNNLRNMLGPHHFVAGEINYTSPANFYKEPCIWWQGTEADWNSEYCFMNFGIGGEKSDTKSI